MFALPRNQTRRMPPQRSSVYRGSSGTYLILHSCAFGSGEYDPAAWLPDWIASAKPRAAPKGDRCTVTFNNIL